MIYVPRRDERVCVCVGGCLDFQSPFHFHPHTRFLFYGNPHLQYCFYISVMFSHLWPYVYVYVPVTHFLPLHLFLFDCLPFPTLLSIKHLTTTSQQPTENSLTRRYPLGTSNLIIGCDTHFIEHTHKHID